MDNLRILIVSTDAEARRALGEAKGEHAGAQIVHTDTVEQGLVHLAAIGKGEAPPVDAILLDTAPGGIEPLAAVTRLHQAAPRVPLVSLGDSGDETVAVATVRAGAQDHLVKGQLGPDTLGRALRLAVERHRASEGRTALLREQEARRDAEATAFRLRLVTEASRALGSTLEPSSVLPEVAALLARATGHLCTIDLVSDDRAIPRAAGGTPALVRIACAVSDERSRQLATALAKYPPDPLRSDDPFVLALGGREPCSVLVDDAFLAASARSDEHRALLEALAVEAVLIVPLVVGDRRLGLLSVARCRREGGERNGIAPPATEPFFAHDRDLIVEVAARTAQAVDQAALYRQATLAARARDEVVSVVSHDLRNPLNVILMAASVLKHSPDLPVERRNQHLDKVMRAVQQMNRLLQDLLDVTRLEAGRFRVDRERQSPQALVSEALELMRPLAAAKAQSLEMRIENDVCDVAADRERMLQVFSNLVGNAIKFTLPGGRIIVAAERRGDRVAFSVTDDGPGIAADDLPHIFNRFYQAKSSSSQGTGLGLAIARGIVEAHGGDLWAESVRGTGSTFAFTLPPATAAANDAPLRTLDGACPATAVQLVGTAGCSSINGAGKPPSIVAGESGPNPSPH